MKKRIGLRAYKVGLEEDLLEKIYSYQESKNWCWAASVQMVLKCRNIFVSQSLLNDILNKDKGKECYPDCPNDFFSIAEYLDKQQFGNIELSAKAFEGAPEIDNLIIELEQNNPIIVGVWNSSTKEIGHAEVLTNIEYRDIGLGRRRKLSTKLFVLDPFASSIDENITGRKIYDSENILSSIRYYLIIKTKLIPSYDF